LFAERLGQRTVVLESPPALLDLLGVRLVFPKIRYGDGRFDVGQFALEAGFVKAPS
jgi:hypothetical protein